MRDVTEKPLRVAVLMVNRCKKKERKREINDKNARAAKLSKTSVAKIYFVCKWDGEVSARGQINAILMCKCAAFTFN